MYAFYIMSDGLMIYIFVPQNFASCSVTNNHKAKRSSPIRRVHLYGNLLMFRHFAYTAHAFKVTPDGLFANTILYGKLFKSLFPLHIVSNNLRFVSPIFT